MMTENAAIALMRIELAYRYANRGNTTARQVIRSATKKGMLTAGLHLHHVVEAFRTNTR